MKKTIILLLTLVLASVIIASGCNTVRGVGQDLEQGGRQLQDASKR